MTNPRRIDSNLGGWLVAAAGACSAAASAQAPAPPVARYTAADEAVYMERFGKLQQAFKLGVGLEAYEPLEPVPGARPDRPLPVASAAARTISDEALRAARDYAGRNNSRALIVWRAGKVEDATYFGGALRTTTFASRSLAKPMTAVAVGRALALGKIRSLDQPVADFVTEWRGDPRRSKILVRHLLDMRSGFLPQAAATTAEDILNRSYLHPRHEQVIIHDYPVVDDPGTRYEYNNATSELVSLVLQRATGRRYAEFISREVIQPIGAPGGEVWVNRPDGIAHSGCCLMVAPETWVRLGILLMQDGVWSGKRLLPPGYVREMTTGTPQNPYYGLGVYVSGNYIARRGFANPAREPEARRVLHSEPYLAADLFMFDGNSNQVVYIVPSEQLVILRVGDAPPRSAAQEWDNSMLPNTILRGIRHKAGDPVPPPQPGR
jgi:CubicO group peptidase (beta-lactamase class C family)